MSRYGIFIDVKKCNGCYNCFLSCRDEYCGNEYPGYSAAQPMSGQNWMQLKEVERGIYPKPKADYIPIPCQHCADAPCMAAATDGAVYRRDDGIVMIDPEKAKGQQAIVNACPYRVISWNEELQLPQKCTLCAHRLDQGEKLPRCVDACPTGALMFGDLDDAGSAIAQAVAAQPVEDLHGEFCTAPQVKYSGIPKRLITGEVVLEDKQDECAQGVAVKLSGAGTELSTTTDIFGDFEFDGLPKGEDYTLTVSVAGYSEASLALSTRTDLNLGEIVLSPK